MYYWNIAVNGLRSYLKERSSNMPDEQKKPTLDEVVQESNEVLVKFKGVFPFDPFPDEVIIDKQAITILRHIFFGVTQKITCHFDDLVNSEVNLGPFFGSLNVYSKYFTDGVETVKWFSRGDAAKIHAILQGLLIAKKEGVDLKNMTKEDILQKLYTIGTHKEL